MRARLNYNKKVDVRKVNKLPSRGKWLPISIAAYMSDYSPQMIRYLYKNKIVRAIKFAVGPILVNYDDIEKNWNRGLTIEADSE